MSKVLVNNNELLELIENEELVIIFGHGKTSVYFEGIIKNYYREKKLVFCDNNKKKCVEDGDNVISVEEATEKYSDKIFIIPSKKYALQMRKQLLEEGISENNIVFSYTEELDKYIRSYQSFNPNAEIPLEELQFEINIAEHCNLNCKCCSQFSCICDEEFIDLDELEKDLARLAVIFNHECKYIYLIGGEPLLNPKIGRCIELCRKNFPHCKIDIFTNGLLLLKQKELFWDCCRLNDVGIIMTKYPINIDCDAIEKKCINEGVKFEYAFGNTDEKVMINKGIDLSGNNDPKYSFTHCPEANNCIKLKHGKLYTCSVAPAIYKFNKFFDRNLPITERDYVDIYKENSKEVILKKLARPIPFCKYCNKEKTAPCYPWGKTQGNIDEWCI